MAFERGNLDYAIDLLLNCVLAEPSFLHGRKYLRAASMQRTKQKKSLFSGLSSTVRNLPGYVRAQGLMKGGKHREAMDLCEKMLTEAPLDLKILILFSLAAAAENLFESSIQSLQIARDHFPDNEDVMKVLGEQYLKGGKIKEGREIFEKLYELRPRDPEVLKALKDATALESLNKDGWADAAEKGTYRDVIKSSEEATLLEKQAKAKKDDKDLDALIEDTLKKLEQEPENINLFRALARYYADKKMFNEALGVLEKAMELSPGDPELDNSWSSMRVRKFEQEVAELRAQGQTQVADEKQQEMTQYVFDDLQERVQRYPNDLGLRYEWGVKLFENDYIDEAIQEFQKSQRSPKHRSRTLYYMALCFKNKKQYDLAVDQLEAARAEIVAMDDLKKDVIYELGTVHELTGNADKAAECFKQIYQVDIGYKDVRQKMETAYNKK